ncbi:MAG: hypothetical protein ABFD82_18500, partial [Syntrophaceae bacterium]
KRREYIMALINKKCPHCGSWMVYSDKEYIWHCKKCARYELRPILIEQPVEKEMIGRQMETIRMETRICSNPLCGKEFEIVVKSKRTVCSRCFNNQQAGERRRRAVA